MSPRYARRSRRPSRASASTASCARAARSLIGILNGVDYDVWNPERDPHLPARYSAAIARRQARVQGGAAARARAAACAPTCRCADRSRGSPIRRASTWCSTALPTLLEGDAAVRRARPGRPGARERAARAGGALSRRSSRCASATTSALAHRIEAGCDLFVMPSRFEPCGLNQMYSLRYGTPPIVRATGGLDDTIVDFDARSRSGTGFKFEPLRRRGALDEAWRRALAAYRNEADFTALVAARHGAGLQLAIAPPRSTRSSTAPSRTRHSGSGLRRVSDGKIRVRRAVRRLLCRRRHEAKRAVGLPARRRCGGAAHRGRGCCRDFDDECSPAGRRLRRRGSATAESYRPPSATTLQAAVARHAQEASTAATSTGDRRRRQRGRLRRTARAVRELFPVAGGRPPLGLRPPRGIVGAQSGRRLLRRHGARRGRRGRRFRRARRRAGRATARPRRSSPTRAAQPPTNRDTRASPPRSRVAIGAGAMPPARDRRRRRAVARDAGAGQRARRLRARDLRRRRHAVAVAHRRRSRRAPRLRQHRARRATPRRARVRRRALAACATR